MKNYEMTHVISNNQMTNHFDFNYNKFVILSMYPFLWDGVYKNESYDTFQAVSFGGWPRRAQQQELNCWARCNAMSVCILTYAHTFNMN